MKRIAMTAFALTLLSAQPFAQTRTTSRAAGRSAPIRSMLDGYCITCHSTGMKAGGVAFAGMSLDAIGDNAEIWEKAVRKMRGHLMPPPGSRQPSQVEVDAFVAAVESALDSAPNRPVAGHV